MAEIGMLEVLLMTNLQIHYIQYKHANFTNSKKLNVKQIVPFGSVKFILHIIQN